MSDHSRQDALARLRLRLFTQLAPEAWPAGGLSPVNQFICAVIVVSSLWAILETEPSISDTLPREIFRFAEVAVGSVFVLEYVARIYAAGEEPRYRGCRGRLLYVASPLALLDLLAIAPFLGLFPTNDLFLLRIFRLLRIVRLARLGRFSLAFQYLTLAIRSRRHELGVSLVIAVMILVLSSALMYVLEGGEQPEAFGSIPRALWWSICTLTTVGYGDVYPLTVAGRVVAGATAIAAIGLIAMPTGILAAAFSDAFQRHRALHQPEPAALRLTTDPPTADREV